MIIWSDSITYLSTLFSIIIQVKQSVSEQIPMFLGSRPTWTRQGTRRPRSLCALTAPLITVHPSITMKLRTVITNRQVCVIFFIYLTSRSRYRIGNSTNTVDLLLLNTFLLLVHVFLHVLCTCVFVAELLTCFTHVYTDILCSNAR
jgi:hypothetical protein